MEVGGKVMVGAQVMKLLALISMLKMSLPRPPATLGVGLVMSSGGVLGDSLEVRGMQMTGNAGAGMSDAPKHYVLPQEHREGFEQRGCKGDMDIDNFCVRLKRSHHEALH
ncbi:hypothetical protein A176_006856 [Myxococcus hansupus]|uniref:Uncharacterized protein n=2 Tax=Pseudomyxococcus hansupus TaxID=1297742 RepID=A0A0H4X421_9BACT|nr:hypothetical protein A176_006856 [Myxococcus hansupus]